MTLLEEICQGKGGLAARLQISSKKVEFACFSYTPEIP